MTKILTEDFQRFRYKNGISLNEYLIEKPPCVLIDCDFGSYFGPGKSPFSVYGVVIMSDIAHVLVDKMPTNITKWKERVTEMFDVEIMMLYDVNDAVHGDEWMEIQCKLERALGEPLWELMI